MAGTRLMVVGVFVVQFISLVVLALYLANDPSYFGSNGASILVDRRGITILQTSNGDGDGDGTGDGDGDGTTGGRNPVSSILSHRLVELRQRVDAVHYPLDFQLGSISGTIDIDGMEGGGDCRMEPTGGGDCDSVEEEDGRLRDAFRLGLETAVSGSDEGVPLDIRVLNKPIAESRRVAGTCDDITARFGASTIDNNDNDNDNDARTINERMGYYILVSRGCTDASLSIGHDAKLSVDESGDMLLSIREGLSITDILSIIKHDVASFIVKEFVREGLSITDILSIIKHDVASFIVKEFVFLSYSHANDHIEEYNNNGKSSWVESTYTLEVVITLLDKDPFSYTNTNNNNNNNNNTSTSSKSKHNHHNQLHQSLSTTVSTHLHPLLNSRLAPLLNTLHIGTQSHPYRATTTTHPTRHKQSLSHQSTKSKTNDYIIHSSKARTVFVDDSPAAAAGDGKYGGVASLVMDQRNTWTAATNVGNAEDVAVTFNLVVYVPPMERTPLKVEFESGGGDRVVSYGTAFAIPERFTAVSIVNLNQPTVATGYDDEDQKDHYDKTVTNALSYFGAFLRKSLGLPILQPHLHSPSTLPTTTTSTGKGRVLLNHIASPYGMAQWEIDKLLRTYWKGKAEEIVNRLENVLELVDWKKDIAFPIESAQKVNSCLQHLHHALDLIDNNNSSSSNRRDIRQSTRSLNAAHRIAAALSIDGDMVPLPDFPLEQRMALLGSMTVPLILPFLIGLMKEYKRYRTLVAKKDTIGGVGE
eukprot:CAMPEP_0198276708 /NCGR_PEP_ID=MMETSP1447-20131203/65455_1 /TAXON_ID=420782 /ORGANISM="Chaetoceros dichaeta, Strain CCMP1751" /LENGTH=757 /DNA_ID=CAMNT_0043971671 /DNA_START=11 /DNA_END=2284 /DNA_ORIENTATION=-